MKFVNWDLIIVSFTSTPFKVEKCVGENYPKEMQLFLPIYKFNISNSRLNPVC